MNVPAGTQVQVAGVTPLTSAGGSAGGAGVLDEILIGALGALAVLVFVFASFLALLPLVIAAVSVTTAFLAILGLTYVTNISFIVQFLVGLIGLGVAIDYSLLLITRWREELAHGHTNETAIKLAMSTAGRAIVFSGVTVALGLLALIALPIPFIRSIGLRRHADPADQRGRHADPGAGGARRGGTAARVAKAAARGSPSRGWTAWARLVVRRRWIAAACALIVLCLLCVAALGLHVGDASVNSLSQQGPARAGVVMLERAGIPTGVLTPIEVFVPRGANPARAVAAASRVPGIRTAVAPAEPTWRRDGTAMVAVLPVPEGASPAGQAAATAVRNVSPRHRRPHSWAATPRG